MKGMIKDAAFILAVYAVAKLINNNVKIPGIADYLPK